MPIYDPFKVVESCLLLVLIVSFCFYFMISLFYLIIRIETDRRSKMLKNTLMGLIFLSSTFMTSTTFAEMGKNGRIKEGTTSNLREYRYSFDRYYLQDAKRNSR